MSKIVEFVYSMLCYCWANYLYASVILGAGSLHTEPSVSVNQDSNKMADKGSWTLALTVCAAAFLSVRSDSITETPAGQLFVYELHREIFQSEFEPFHKVFGHVYNDPMVFKCNKERFPDLPRWLRFTQRDPYENGFLYGTPLTQDQGRNIIEIFVTNKRSYDTFRERLVINVGPAVKQMPYQAEFFIELREIEKVLPSAVQEEIRLDVQKMWRTERLDFINISSALDRGGRVPLPLPGYFEGVYVKLGSDRPFSECLLRLSSSEHQRECVSGRKISGDCSTCSNPANCISWCRSELLDQSRPAPPAPAPTEGPGVLPWAGEFIPPESPPDRDFFPDYMLTVIAPLALVLLLCLLLTYIMCCRREGVLKRNTKTPDLQLYHQRTIQGNAGELRRMAGGERSTVDRPRQCLQPLLMNEQAMAQS
ncbi:alpha-sarcoglycan [Puntigrus tetrazona]|uniref:alpha-sarcoglycan n=1 Tax=Puntigrus tetrazona TaxID=1606681 RepID=UPI001C8A74C0|nr:alpha-sarcoglycan [Puntigrus tetrazona]